MTAMLYTVAHGVIPPLARAVWRPAAGDAVVLVADGDRLADPHGHVDLAQARSAGTGQVGAGLVTPPAACFTAALTALAQAARR